ncbi:hypothetical protein [Photorhabdus australis]|uniref:hypothetical protein n=1 Tax=Photorhabdus australis TaxID=286156 RepID=UPI000B14E9CA
MSVKKISYTHINSNFHFNSYCLIKFSNYIPVIFQVASLLAASTPVTSLSMLPGIRFLAVAIHLEIYWV